MNEQLNSITNELFSHNAVEILDGGDTTDALYDALVEKANNVINEYGWDVVFESWENFMYENCNSVEDALNFATWFEIYGGHNHKIAEPYKFLAYLYDIFDLNPVKYNAQIMDDVSYGLLEAAGIKKNLWSDDYYTTENDPELVNAVKKLRKERNQ
jgi:hypothetical protein